MIASNRATDRGRQDDDRRQAVDPTRGRSFLASVRSFGDTGLMVFTTDLVAARQVAGLIAEERTSGAAPADLGDVVVGFGGVLVTFPLASALDSALDSALASVEAGGSPDPWPARRQWLAEILAIAETDHRRGAPDLYQRAGSPGSDAESPPTLRTHYLPVVFDGPDLDDSARRLDIDTADLVALITDRPLTVALVGFAPGFAYLDGIAPPLAALPRLQTPRPSVPAGSVAVGGGYAGIYPRSSPGGWRLLGTTPITLFDPTRPPYVALAVGDVVHFVAESSPGRPRTAPVFDQPSVASVGPGNAPRESDAVDTHDARDRTSPPVPTPPYFEVLEPGLYTTVQDGGRSAVAAMGIPTAGAADPDALLLANLLVGNAPQAAALECTAIGPRLLLRAPDETVVHVAVVGASADSVTLNVDGWTVPSGTVTPLRDGSTVAVSAIGPGLRAVLAVSGSLTVPAVVGSRSSDMLSGLGPGPLRPGQLLSIGKPGRPRGHLVQSPGADETGPIVLRMVPGPHGDNDNGDNGDDGDTGDNGTAGDQREALVGTQWTVDAQCDRIGVRLSAPVTDHRSTRPTIPSVPMGIGAIQVPPDGRPIVLLVDHGTLGGYPVIGCVIAADRSRLGQLTPGDAVRFEACTAAEATSLHRRHQQELVSRVTGWYPTQAAT